MVNAKKWIMLPIVFEKKLNIIYNQLNINHLKCGDLAMYLNFMGLLGHCFGNPYSLKICVLTYGGHQFFPFIIACKYCVLNMEIF